MDRIAVVGCGPAGCSVALHTQAIAPEVAGRIVLFDRALYPRDKPCGGGLTALAVGLLRSFEADLLHEGSEWISNVIVAGGARVENVGLRKPMAVIHRRALDARVVDVARRRGVAFEMGTRITGVETSGDGAVLSGSGSDVPFRAVVGADGAKSTIRRAIQRRRGGLARLIEVVTVDRMDQPSQLRSSIVFDFSAMERGLQGYVWRFPCVVDGVPSINWGIFDSRIYDGEPRADLAGLLSEFMTTHDYAAERENWVSHPVRRFDPECVFAAPNVFLVGDAAGVDPALGEGISLALDYGDLAGHVLADAAARDDYSFATYKEQLFAHPVGQSLMARHRMALELYRPRGAGGADRAVATVAEWITSAAAV